MSEDARAHAEVYGTLGGLKDQHDHAAKWVKTYSNASKIPIS